MDILFEAAKSWIELSKSYYIITYGLRKKLYDLKIVFDNYDFYHLAGFQYLNDLTLPAVSRAKIINAILDGKINGEYIIKGKMYLSQVKTRLTALINLEFALDNDFRLFKYNPNFYPFYTQIEADYLIEGYSKDSALFFFTIKIDKNYQGASIFMKGDRDFSANHKSLSLLKKEKLNVYTNKGVSLFDKLSSQKQLK